MHFSGEASDNIECIASPHPSPGGGIVGGVENINVEL